MMAKTAEAVRPLFDVSVPDVLLPEQFFDRLTARTSDTPERRLLFAVLLDAVILLQRRNTSGSAEAERWIRNEADSDFPFSFRNLCEALGIEPAHAGSSVVDESRSFAHVDRERARQAFLGNRESLGLPQRRLTTTDTTQLTSLLPKSSAHVRRTRPVGALVLRCSWGLYVH